MSEDAAREDAIRAALASSLGTDAVVRVAKLDDWPERARDEHKASSSAYRVNLDLLASRHVTDWLVWLMKCAEDGRLEWSVGEHRVVFIRLAWRNMSHPTQGEVWVRVLKGKRGSRLSFSVPASHKPGIDCAVAQGKSCSLCQNLAMITSRQAA